MNKKTLIAFAVLASVSVVAFAGGQKHPSSKSLKHSTSKGAPPANLGETDADRNMKAVKSPKKGGAKAKGAMGIGTFHVDNGTDYNIDCWIDGTYVGRTGGYGDMYFSVYSGTHSFYARSAGQTASWGPDEFYMVSDTTFTEHLH